MLIIPARFGKCIQLKLALRAEQRRTSCKTADCWLLYCARCKGSKMIQKCFLFCVMVCATLVVATSAKRYRLWQTINSGLNRRLARRHRRSALDTRYMDIARSAFTSLVTDKGLKPNSKFHRAIDEIEKALAMMQAHRGNLAFQQKEAEEFMKIVERSAKSGNIESFRKVLGRAIFRNITLSAARQQRSAGVLSRGEETKALLDGAKAFLSDIKQQIGKEHFEELISINGEVTLVFVIDSTGSMREDIEAAKAVAEEIIVHDREVPVSFMLSTFNDPDVGPIVYHDENNLGKAITAIGNITVNGGGDCPEMTFEGLLQALYYSPMPGSALYVFTDAYAKDGTRENIETVTALAIDLGISVYFFTTGDCNEGPAKMANFKSVAQATGGLMFPLHSSKEIKKLSKFVSKNLQGGATVDSNTANETSTKTYTIVVDDTIKTLLLTVVMSKIDIDVRLMSPNGVEQDASNRLDMNLIFNVENPTPGNWTLEVPSTAGDIEYIVKTISKLNIDFSHHYFKYLPKKSSKNHIPVVHPLLGKDAMVMITIYEMQHVDNSSLHLNVVYKNGTHDGTFKVQTVGLSGMRFLAKLRVYKGPYKLQLVGKTKSGHRFTRLAQAYDEAKPFRLRVVYASRYTLPVGKKAKLILAIDNPTAEKYDFDVKDSFGYAQHVEPKGRHGPNTRQRTFELTFNVPASATANINKTNRVVIRAIGNQTGIVSTEITHLLVTPMQLDN